MCLHHTYIATPILVAFLEIESVFKMNQTWVGVLCIYSYKRISWVWLKFDWHRLLCLRLFNELARIFRCCKNTVLGCSMQNIILKIEWHDYPLNITKKFISTYFINCSLIQTYLHQHFLTFWYDISGGVSICVATRRRFSHNVSRGWTEKSFLVTLFGIWKKRVAVIWPCISLPVNVKSYY